MSDSELRVERLNTAKRPISQQGATQDIPVLRSKIVLHSANQRIAFAYLASLFPTLICKQFMVGRTCKCRTAVTFVVGDDNLKKMFGRTIIEPIYYATRFDSSRLFIVGKHLDRHTLIDDFPDLFSCSIGQTHASIVMETAKHYTNFLTELVGKDDGGLGT